MSIKSARVVSVGTAPLTVAMRCLMIRRVYLKAKQNNQTILYKAVIANRHRMLQSRALVVAVPAFISKGRFYANKKQTVNGGDMRFLQSISLQRQQR
ncbi:MAG: hypothetical protein FWH04_00810 [Oscillospiraceae bacterium]|nr:hypothetical protein [Oscillospiraceae bacterium]